MVAAPVEGTLALQSHAKGVSKRNNVLRFSRGSWVPGPQEIAFFDDNRTGELMNRLSSDTATLQVCTP